MYHSYINKFQKFLLLFVCFTYSIICIGQNPANYGGVSVWFTSDSITIGGSNEVLEWRDISGNLNNGTQGVAINQPLFVNSVSTLNNHGIIRFDGTQDFLEITDNSSIDFDTAFTIIVLAKQNVLASSEVLLSKWDYATQGSWAFQSNNTSSDELSLFVANSLTDPGVNTIFTTNANLNDTIYSILTITYSGSQTPKVKFYTNFNLVLSSTTGSISSSLQNSSASLKLGKFGGSLIRYYNGDMAEVIIYNQALDQDTLNKLIPYFQNKYAPPVNLGIDINVSYNFCDTILYASNRFSSYLWSTGDASDSIIINKSGIYWVVTTDIFGFQSSDTINVSYPKVTSSTLNDTTLCSQDTVILSSLLDKNGYNFLWSDFSTDSLLNITQAGNYWVTATDTLGCSFNSDTITIIVDSFAVQTSLGPDKTICQGASLGLVSGTNPVSYLWNTGDTTAQTVVNSAGQYWIQTSNSNNCIANDTIQITLNGIAPTVGFSTLNLCVNDVVNFTDTSFTSDGSNIVSWNWNFGDGDTSIVQHPQHQYSLSNSYTAILTVLSDSGCTNSSTQNIQIHNPPTAGFFVATSPICSGQTTSFTDNSFCTDGTITAWMWDFGDTGNLDTSSIQNSSYVFPVTSNYNVQLIVSSSFNCKDTITNVVTVKASPVPSFTTSNTCVNTPTAFTNTSQGNIVSFNWNFGDANTSLLTNPNNTYTSSGNYNVSLVTTELNGCIDTLITPITIYNNPIASYMSKDFCVLSTKQLFDSSSTTSGVITNWDWNVVNHSNQSNNQNPSFSFAVADTGFYSLDLMVTTDVGCKDSIRDTINVYPLPIPQFTFSPTEGASPLTVNFNNQTIGAVSSNWDFGDNSFSNDSSPVHVYLDTNLYTINLIATSNFGCVDSSSKSIHVAKLVLDAVVADVSYYFIAGTNFFTISAQLINYGTIDITSLDLVAEISGSTTMMEKWTGTMNIGNQMMYQFVGSLEISDGIVPDLVCVKALNPNGGIDDFPSNNEFCVALNKFQIISIYPNPTSSTINVEYILPSKGDVSITFHNAIGQKIAELYTGEANKGINRHLFNLAPYSNGVYIIEIVFGEEKIKEKIIIK